MKRMVLAIGLVFVLTGTAEAGMGTALKNLWGYTTSPVNCLLNLSTAVVADLAAFGRCVVANMNRNPFTLTSLVTQLPTTE